MKESKFYQEIMDEGRLEEAKNMVREALLLLFGIKGVEKFEDRITRSKSLEEMARMHRLAVQSESIEAFRREMALAARPEGKTYERKKKN